MDVPEVWLLLGVEVHQDFLIDNPDLLRGFREIFDRFTSAQRQELHQFLGDMLSRELSARELSLLWSESRANLIAVEEDMRNFLEVILGALESSISSNG